MDEDIAALEHTSTWDLVSPPPCVRTITWKWVYKINTRSKGSLAHYKVRVVARGFQQGRAVIMMRLLPLWII
jgi:hypothetical protein